LPGRPVSTGSVRINWADPTLHQDIDTNYYSAPGDRATTRECIRIGREIMAREPLKSFPGDEYAPGAAVRTDEDLGRYILHSGETTTYHAKAAVRWAARTLPWSMTAFAYGVAGPRVAGVSNMPRVVSGNTSAARVMIAERTAAFLDIQGTRQRLHMPTARFAQQETHSDIWLR
jgi:choline dehydrogenase